MQLVFNDVIQRDKWRNRILMNRRWKHIVIATAVSLCINIVFFVSSATPVSSRASMFDRILMWLGSPAEVFTDWILPGHISLKQIIVMFAFSLFFYAIVVLFFLKLVSWGYGSRRK